MSATLSRSVSPDASSQLQCPSCGMTLGRFQKEVLLGCPHDYEFFDNSLRGIIEKSQGGNNMHCGKVPSKLPDDSKKQIDIVNLQRQLDVAVKNEDYETAASLRDQIKKLQ